MLSEVCFCVRIRLVLSLEYGSEIVICLGTGLCSAPWYVSGARAEGLVDLCSALQCLLLLVSTPRHWEGFFLRWMCPVCAHQLILTPKCTVLCMLLVQFLHVSPTVSSSMVFFCTRSLARIQGFSLRSTACELLSRPQIFRGSARSAHGTVTGLVSRGSPPHQWIVVRWKIVGAGCHLHEVSSWPLSTLPSLCLTARTN